MRIHFASCYIWFKRNGLWRKQVYWALLWIWTPSWWKWILPGPFTPYKGRMRIVAIHLLGWLKWRWASLLGICLFYAYDMTAAFQQSLIVPGFRDPQLASRQWCWELFKSIPIREILFWNHNDRSFKGFVGLQLLSFCSNLNQLISLKKWIKKEALPPISNEKQGPSCSKMIFKQQPCFKEDSAALLQIIQSGVLSFWLALALRLPKRLKGFKTGYCTR